MILLCRVVAFTVRQKQPNSYATFDAWWNSESHRTKYSNDHPVYLGAFEAWEAARREPLSPSDREIINQAANMLEIAGGALTKDPTCNGMVEKLRRMAK